MYFGADDNPSLYYGAGYGYGEEYEFEPGPEADEGFYGEMPLENGVWHERIRLQDDMYAVNCLKFDDFEELLWAGYADGRMTSYDAASMERVTSVMAHPSAVRDLVVLDQAVLSVSDSQIRMHTRGCLLTQVFQPQEPFATEYASGSHQYQCILPLHPDPTTMEAPSKFVVAGTAPAVLLFDMLDATKTLNAVHLPSGLSSVAESKYFVGGGMDGRLYLLDWRMRSTSLQHTLDAHAGPVVDIAAHEDTVVSVGMCSRQVNPYDPNSVTTWFPDPILKVFDLRMMRQIAPLSFPAVKAPCMVNFATAFGPTIVVAGSSGSVVMSDVSGDATTLQAAKIYLEQGDTLTTMATSSSGALAVFGTSSGVLVEYSQKLEPTVNATSRPVQRPEKYQPPLLSLPPDSPVLATSYVMMPQRNVFDPLSSSFETTPSVATRKLRLSSQRRINPQLLSSAVYHDFLGTIPNSKYKANSLLFGHNNDAYVECDPRKTSTSMTSQDTESTLANIPSRYRYFVHKRSPLGPALDIAPPNPTDFIGLDNDIPTAYGNAFLQLMYWMPEVRDTLLNLQLSSWQHTQNDTLGCELGILYQMMDQMRNYNLRAQPNEQVMKICSAANFMRTLQQIPEAVALELLESSKGQLSLRQKGERFCRFLLQKLAQECQHELDDASQEITHNVFADLFGFDVTITTNFLISKTSTESVLVNHLFALELAYPEEPAGPAHDAAGARQPAPPAVEPPEQPSFSQLLANTICKETRMRGWCAASEKYEPFVQTRRAHNLPPMLAIQCATKTPQHSALWVQHEMSVSEGAEETGGVLALPWLPFEVEVALLESDDVVVAERLTAGPNQGKWRISYRTSSQRTGRGVPELSDVPLSELSDLNIRTIDRYELCGVVSHINASANKQQQSEAVGSSEDGSGDGHLVLHLRLPDPANALTQRWFLFNNMLVEPVTPEDVTWFNAGWKQPCMVFFKKRSLALGADPTQIRDVKLPSSVLSLPSVGKVKAPPLPADDLPGAGDVIAFDAEFVSVEMENAIIDAAGKRTVQKEGRQVVARMSLVDARTDTVLLDDYVLPVEPVADYLTRFSGLVPEDLNPNTSRHHLVSPKTALLKLKYFIDRGCIFVGHGLEKDFHTCNVFVSPENVRDTVELWHLPGRRKISLRFLASFVLKHDIQDGVHDSIEDAKTALALYRAYLREKEQGTLDKTLADVYEYGHINHWKIGHERLQSVQR